MKHILRECFLDFQLTYSGERLFGASILKATWKSVKESIKCFVDLIKPCNEDIF